MNQEQRAALRKLAGKDTVGSGISRTTILQLLDYIETLDKDAARYRWLRKSNWFSSGIIHDAPYGRRSHDSHEYLDAAIDAAMQGETE